MPKIINYHSSYYDKLLYFIKKTWKNRKNATDYLNYRLLKVSNNLLDIEKNLLVLNDNDEIVGCNFFFPAKATILGEVHTLYWSHDTYIEEKYRGDLGMELLLRTNSTKRMFGFGLSPIVKKIQQKLKTNFIAKTMIYFIFNRWSIKILLYKLGILLPKENDLIIPNKIKVNKVIFELKTCVEDVSIPNEGYWNKGELDIEINRDESFLRHRFFENHNTYYFFQKKEKKSYFVVRKILLLGIPTISLVDFRCDLDDFDEYLQILRAVNKIAIKNRIPLVLTLSTILDKKVRLFPILILRYLKTRDIITNIKSIKNPSIFITSADSDADLLM